MWLKLRTNQVCCNES